MTEKNISAFEALGGIRIGTAMPRNMLGSVAGLDAIPAGIRWRSALTASADIDKAIAAARNELANLKESIETRDKEHHNTKAQLEELMTKHAELERLLQVQFVHSRVAAPAQGLLLRDQCFADKFLSAHPCQAFVLAVDIRRSTELMLKAKSPEQFADFLKEVCDALEETVKENFGVFDKFTGDGILAFFPDFYSGKDAGYHVIHAAEKCHQSFATIYRKHRSAFSSVLMNAGLGIGIDHGSVRLLPASGGLTVVGIPVVYACRLSGAPVGKTLLNQSAYEQITDTIGGHVLAEETGLTIKHEEEILCYDIRLGCGSFVPALPDWLSQPGGQDTPATPATAENEPAS